MKTIKIILRLTLVALVILSCTSESNNLKGEEDYSSLIKTNGNKIVNSTLLEKHFESFSRTESNSEYVLTQEQLDSYLETLNIPEEYKSSLNLEEVNNLLSKLVDYHISDNITDAVSYTSLSSDTKEGVLKLVEDRSVQDVKELVNFDLLPQNEKETLLVINDITNDYFSENNMQEASILPLNLAFLFSRNCTGSGPNGSGPINCSVAFTLVGASIGGSCCGLGGAIIGGVVGFIFGSTLDKL